MVEEKQNETDPCL